MRSKNLEVVPTGRERGSPMFHEWPLLPAGEQEDERARVGRSTKDVRTWLRVVRADGGSKTNQRTIELEAKRLSVHIHPALRFIRV